jgi:glyoxylase-like metal-dependent hydrolase (beta-lactamase superfamily II)
MEFETIAVFVTVLVDVTDGDCVVVDAGFGDDDREL